MQYARQPQSLNKWQIEMNNTYPMTIEFQGEDEMNFQITHKTTGSVLFELECENLKLCVQEAVKSGANLSGAKLTGANLTGADLTGANLDGVTY